MQRDTRTIMIGCRKGGVTKTTATVNLAYELSKLGKKILVLDFDSQGDTTKFFKRTDTEYYVGDILKERGFDIRQAIYPAIVGDEAQENLHICPARTGDVMTKLDMDMISLTRREDRLKMHLDKIAGVYDFILIDTSPSTSVLGLNAVMAATEYLFSTEFKENSLAGVETLLEHIQDVKYITESEIKFLVVPSKIDRREKKAMDYGMTYLTSRWPNQTSKTIIWNRSVFGDAETQYEPLSYVNKKHEAAAYYSDLAREVIDNVQ